jgi:addiction module RelE/StbE family toxin
MNYKIVFLPSVLKQDLKKLNKTLKESFVSAIQERIAKRPYDFKHLSGKKYHNFWRMRVGDYRIAYSISEEEKTITIWCIDIRGNIYDKLQSRVDAKIKKH